MEKLLMNLSSSTFEKITLDGPVIIHQNFVESINVSMLIKDYDEEGTIPAELDIAIDAIIEFTKGKTLTERKRLKAITQKWINKFEELHPLPGNKTYYNKII